MEDSATFRDRITKLYALSRCGNTEAYSEILHLSSSTSHLSPEDSLVVNGYLGGLLFKCNTPLVPRNETRARAL